MAEVARRIDLKDMPGVFHKTLAVPQGYQALLLGGEKHDATLGPGSYRYGSGDARGMAAVLVPEAELPLQFSVRRALTSDPFPIDLDCQLVVQVQAPLLFYIQAAKGASLFTQEQLVALLQNEAEALARNFVGHHNVQEWQNSLALQGQLELELDQHLARSLSAWGLRVARVTTVNYRCQAQDKLTGIKADYALQVSQEEAQLQGRKRLFEVLTESELQSLVEETERTAVFEKRTALWERMRRAVVADHMASVRSEQDLADFLRQVDRDQLLKESELEDLKATLRQAREDKDRAYAFLVYRTEMERDHELKKLELAQRKDLALEEIAFEVDLERRKLEGQWQVELQRLDFQLEKDRRLAEVRRQEAERERQAQEEKELAAARAGAAIADIERQQLNAEVEDALNWYDRYKRMKEQQRLQQVMDDLDGEERKMALDLRRQEGELELRLREQRERHKQDLERIDTLSKVSVEVLMAVSGPEQGRMLAELARTRTLAGCSPQQILAMQAQGDPQVAQALVEVTKAMAATGQTEMYERLVAQVKDSAQASREDYQRNVAIMAEMFHKAMDTMKDTATAFARA
ncbi:MAG: hypothetical protein HYY01_03280 [Chloroflexi bacterium]|nr:hypothetical protein [Chloroflexota bacterium]